MAYQLVNSIRLFGVSFFAFISGWPKTDNLKFEAVNTNETSVTQYQSSLHHITETFNTHQQVTYTTLFAVSNAVKDKTYVFDKGCIVGYSVFFASFYNETNSQLTNRLFYRCIIYHTMPLQSELIPQTIYPVHCQRIVVPTVIETPLQRGRKIPCHKNLTTITVTTKIKVKFKVHPCTGTEALYRPYGP